MEITLVSLLFCLTLYPLAQGEALGPLIAIVERGSLATSNASESTSTESTATSSTTSSTTSPPAVQTPLSGNACLVGYFPSLDLMSPPSNDPKSVPKVFRFLLMANFLNIRMAV